MAGIWHVQGLSACCRKLGLPRKLITRSPQEFYRQAVCWNLKGEYAVLNRIISGLSSKRYSTNTKATGRRNNAEKSGNSKRKPYPSRSEKMDPATTDWPSVFSTAQSYNIAVIPPAIRMGRWRENRVKGGAPPTARGNIELLKIPNFFHLTPPAIQKHCEALKKLCSPWPEDIGTKPLRITTRNYIFAGPSIEHPGSRKVTLQVYLKDLELDDHARKKMTILAGTRYNPNTDELTLEGDKCPTRKQNKDYVIYLLTALYHESWKTEPWELEVSSEDLEGLDILEEVQNLFYPAPARQRRNKKCVRLIGDKLVRFNQYGKPFLIPMGRHRITGPLTKEMRELAEKEWKTIAF